MYQRKRRKYLTVHMSLFTFSIKISYALEIVIEIKTYTTNCSGTLIATFAMDSLKLKSK